ncbi:hypothetical protein B4Q23_2016 [Lacticaseibacillus paracasei]|jgi:hypothetical protein|nr:hypothetical protein B4Q23_2016 [Lacticaseibacillus paracasei]OUC73601.1 hypothetical protein BWK52_0467c [Lacticaseibacillus paracasei]
MLPALLIVHAHGQRSKPTVPIFSKFPKWVADLVYQKASKKPSIFVIDGFFVSANQPG